MSRDRTSVAVKRRTNVTLDAALLDAARALDLNVSAIAETALDQAVRAARAEAWRAENTDAMARRTAWIEANGLPLAAWQSWKP
ncbi:type II toxin-antitoxin system CcdA family antitoxin [Rubrimonas cliftonensis]|nr:type II toxin-antitoxin system CcdA family antitoxin [Rubrimonas cliftonensis]